MAGWSDIRAGCAVCIDSVDSIYDEPSEANFDDVDGELKATRDVWTC